MATVLRHHGITFDGETLYRTGHAYVECKFYRCTLIYTGFPPTMLDRCHFEDCVWHINMVLSDAKHAVDLLALMKSLIVPSLPAPPTCNK